MDSDETDSGRREFLKCMAWAGTGALFTVAAGVPTSMGLDAALAAPPRLASFSFLQISDSHIGFAKPANPDARATFREAIAKVKALPQRPDFIIHTGDVSQLSRDEEFDDAHQMLLAKVVSGETIGERADLCLQARQHLVEGAVQKARSGAAGRHRPSQIDESFAYETLLRSRLPGDLRGGESVERVHEAVDALEVRLKRRCPEVRRVIAHAEPLDRPARTLH